MGEISIDPKFNIQETYKKVRILNPYRNQSGISLNEGLIAHYTFEDAQANTSVTSDETGSFNAIGRGLNASSLPHAATGKIGLGVSMTQSEQNYFDTGTNTISGGRTAFTVACFIKIPAIVTPSDTIIWSSWGNGHIFRILLSGYLSFTLNTNTGGRLNLTETSITISQPNTFYHVIAEYDGSKMRIFNNASMVAETSKTGTTSFGLSNDFIGALPAAALYQEKTIDDFRFYNRVLTQNGKNILAGI